MPGAAGSGCPRLAHDIRSTYEIDNHAHAQAMVAAMAAVAALAANSAITKDELTTIVDAAAAHHLHVTITATGDTP